jgi:predicted nuclease with TOPRIM domain
MPDKQRNGRAADDRDVTAKARIARANADDAGKLYVSSDADRLGREAQRRAKAYARARGQL